MSATKQITLKEYEQMLKSHDWYYMMSDDPQVYKKGCYKQSELKEIAETNSNFKAMFDIYKNKHKIT